MQHDLLGAGRSNARLLMQRDLFGTGQSSPGLSTQRDLLGSASMQCDPFGEMPSLAPMRCDLSGAGSLNMGPLMQRNGFGDNFNNES